MTLGIDLSERVVRIVRLDPDGRVKARAELQPGDLPRRLRSALGRVIDGASASSAAVAISLPGAELAPEFVASVREATPGLRISHVVSAGTAVALAETTSAASGGARSVVGLAVGEHVSAGLLIDGRPWLGAHGMAGSVGWLALNPVEREDYRRFGGLEAEISAAGIVRRFVWRAKSGDHSSVADQVEGDFSRLTANDIFQGARAGDGVCISVVRDTSKYLGMAVANLVSFFDPTVVILGGAIAESGDLMLEPVRVECARRVRPQHAERLSISLAALGADAVAIGAARAAALRDA